MDRDIVTMITCILGFTTNEYVDEMTFAYMSIFTHGQPPVAKFDNATFIADKVRWSKSLLE